MNTVTLRRFQSGDESAVSDVTANVTDGATWHLNNTDMFYVVTPDSEGVVTVTFNGAAAVTLLKISG